MSVDLSALQDAPRLLIDVDLQPVQGRRFQPTGFPDLGPARFRAPQTDGSSRECLLVESAQSMANRLEATLWDQALDAPIPAAEGLSYVRVEHDGSFLTSSLTESHRLNSPYILEGKDKAFAKQLREELDCLATGPIDRSVLARTVLRYDANALLHGLFLAKKELAGGRLRITRALSAFVEATDVAEAASGGVKNDHVDPSGDTKKGFGNVPFQREEFTAATITAYFNLDLQLVRGYGLGESVERLLIVLALYKIRALLRGQLRLRTACDLDVVDDGIHVRRPEGFVLPSLDDLEVGLREAIISVKDQMTVTTVSYAK